MPEIEIPYNWAPKRHQLTFWAYMQDGGLRAVLVWHRRAGKDSTSLNITARKIFERIGTYWHMGPEASHVRKFVWDAIDKEGRRIINQAFPEIIRRRTVDDEMKIEFKNGSIWQCVGSDNYDSLVGANPIGVVFSEWSLADPKAWDYIRPILAENGGYVIFIFTPRGRNHGHRIYEIAKKTPGWFAERLTVDDTGVISPATIQAERDTGMDDDDIQQEYYVSFDAAIKGAYYGKLLNELEKREQICGVPYEPKAQVYTAWDLGIGDSTAIWFAQMVGREVRIIDYYQASGAGLDHYTKMLGEKPYSYVEHILPHDADIHELGTGNKRVDTLNTLGILYAKQRVLPRAAVDDGIQAVRSLLPKCWFDEKNCHYGLDALKQYQKEWDERAHDFKKRPKHDWTSHAADAFRYLALGLPAQLPGTIKTGDSGKGFKNSGGWMRG